MNERIVNLLSSLEPLGATEFYIGLRSNDDGEFSYVNGKSCRKLNRDGFERDCILFSRTCIKSVIENVLEYC